MKKTIISLLNTVDDHRSFFPRLIVGLVFLVEGIQKLLYIDLLGTSLFREIGFENYHFWTIFVSIFEIVCGLMVLTGFFVRIASVPLLVIIITAIFTTKIPILAYKGFWAMAHQSEVDFAMICLLIFLLTYGAGKLSFDYRLQAKRE